MNGQERVVVVGGPLDDVGAGGSHCIKQHGGALRHLGAGLPDAEPDFAIRVVQQTVVMPDGGEADQCVMIRR